MQGGGVSIFAVIRRDAPRESTGFPATRRATWRIPVAWPAIAAARL